MSEPYIIKASEFDPEKHETPIVDLIENGWTWGPGSGMCLGCEDCPVVVRDKPKPVTLEDVLTEHWHLADEIRKAGLAAKTTA